MNINYTDDVRAFQEKFGLVMPEKFTFLAQDLFQFRLKFFIEEIKEYEEAVEQNNLPDAIDAMIDLVYITSGCALLCGISVGEFEKIIDKNTIAYQDLVCNVSKEDENNTPHLPSKTNHQIILSVLQRNLEQFIDGWQSSNQTMIKDSLAALYRNAFYASLLMGFSMDQWNELWADVQRANMAKERVLKAEDSKRGSAYDVRKPAGWVAPRTQELVSKFVKDSMETSV